MARFTCSERGPDLDDKVRQTALYLKRNSGSYIVIAARERIKVIKLNSHCLRAGLGKELERDPAKAKERNQ